MAAAFPDRGIAVFLLALFIEAVNLGDLPGFVVAANEGNAVGIADLEAKEEGEGFETEVATVDKIAEENVVLITGDACVAFLVHTETGSIVPTGHFATALLLFFVNVFIA